MLNVGGTECACRGTHVIHNTADIVGITVTKIKQVTVNLYHTTSDPNVSILKCFPICRANKKNVRVSHLINDE